MNKLTAIRAILFGCLLLSTQVSAHVSEQGLVLLLPTQFYITTGVLVVVLTLALVVWLPIKHAKRLFNSFVLFKTTEKLELFKIASSLFATSLLLLLVYLGYSASYDPLENPLPLFIWTVWWIGLVIVHGVLGNWWAWLNPWTGILALLKRTDKAPMLKLPDWVGQWPAVLIFLLFISFSLADTAPESPERLASFVFGYWLVTLVAALLFGASWLSTGECFTVMFSRFAQLAALACSNSDVRVGLFGWKLLTNKATTVSSAVFILVLLGCGSFDGLNETFWWLSVIGVNPLDFPGRSAIILETVVGLLAANALLIIVYALCIYAGLLLVRKNTSDGGVSKVTFMQAFCALSISVLPIAFAYHFAHYLTSFMVNIQYVIATLSDPLDNGSDWLGLGTFYVTTGFLNTPQTVKAIWLSQAAAVTAGHVLSVLIAHAIALELFGSARRAIVSQAPLALFMVVYTFIGLWLLAAAKGA